jgi:hypothetical protein
MRQSPQGLKPDAEVQVNVGTKSSDRLRQSKKEQAKTANVRKRPLQKLQISCCRVGGEKQIPRFARDDRFLFR